MNDTNIVEDNRFLFLDAEFGGIGFEYSLLTVYFQVTDKNFNVLGELDLAVKPNDGIYHICGEAMNVNKIDIRTHDSRAINYTKAGTELYNFLKLHSDGGKIKLIPTGHGVRGDLDQVWDKLLRRKSWESFCSYRMMDTSILIQFFKSIGKLPVEVSGSLELAAKYFNITPPSGDIGEYFHNAKYDTLMTKEVYFKLRELGK